MDMSRMTTYCHIQEGPLCIWSTRAAMANNLESYLSSRHQKMAFTNIQKLGIIS